MPSRFRRLLRVTLGATLGLALGLVALPSAAQPIPPPSMILVPLPIKTVTVVGAGETVEAAVNDALEAIRESYLVLDSDVLSSRCDDVQINPAQDPTETIPLCSATVEAKVIRKTLWIRG